MSIIQQQFDRQLSRPGKTGVDWYLFYYFLNLTKKSPAIEFGVGNGGSLFTMVDVNTDVTAVDNWAYNWEKKDVSQVIENSNKNVTWIDKDSLSLTSNDLKKYGFVHLDANKSFNGTLHDLDLAQDISTNLICVDDYMNSLWPEVTWAVDHWLTNNKSWKRVLVGNHQVFLSKNSVNIKELVLTMPLINQHDTWYISYGPYDDCVKPFIEHGKLMFSWHTTSTDSTKSEW